jgi:hypothetical protein
MMNLATHPGVLAPTTSDAGLIENLLGKTPQAIVEEADGHAVELRVWDALVTCARSLAALDEMDTAGIETKLIAEVLDAVESDAVAMIRDITAETNLCVARLFQLFPAPVDTCAETKEGAFDDTDLDFSFDCFEDASTPAANDVSALAAAKGNEPSVAIALAIGMLSSMLRDDNARFARRIRTRTDIWDLVGELQDFRERCCTCLQAIVKACLEACCATKVPESALPRHRKRGIRLVRLRAALFQMAGRVAAMGQATNQASFGGSRNDCLQIILDHMASEAWSDTPLAEKRTFVGFRSQFRRQDSASVDELPRTVEGFLRFLELARGKLNSREMVEHDVDALRRLIADIDAGFSTERCLKNASVLLGCDEVLDGLITACERDASFVNREDTRRVAQRVLRELASAN